MLIGAAALVGNGGWTDRKTHNGYQQRRGRAEESAT
jgi:hypothetical protein